MSRYIDADRLIAHLKDEIEECDPKCGGRPDIAYGVTLGLKSAIAFAEALSADVVEVRHGHWTDSAGNYVEFDEVNKGCPKWSCYCSVCGEWLAGSDEYPCFGYFCPKMRCKDGR